MIKNKGFDITVAIAPIFLLLTLQYILFFYIEEGRAPRVVLYIIYLATIILPIILIQTVRLKYTIFRSVFIFYYLFLAIISLFYMEGDFGQILAGFLIYLAIVNGFYFSKFRIEYLGKVFKYIAILGIIVLPYVLSLERIDVDSALKRDYTWTEMFFFAPIYWAVIPCVILAVLLEKNILVSFIYWVGAVVINLLFLKRFIIVDSLMLIIIIFIINSQKTKKVFSNVKFAALAFVLLAAVLYLKSDLITTLFQATTERIETGSEDVSAFDRWIETSNYLEEANVIQLIFGNGFSGIHMGLGSPHYALHIGWSNFVFKGGIILLLLILVPFLKAFRLLSKVKTLPLHIQFSIWYLCIYFFRLFYGNMHNFSPEMLIFFFAVFNVMDYSGKKMHKIAEPQSQDLNTVIK